MLLEGPHNFSFTNATRDYNFVEMCNFIHKIHPIFQEWKNPFNYKSKQLAVQGNPVTSKALAS